MIFGTSGSPRIWVNKGQSDEKVYDIDFAWFLKFEPSNQILVTQDELNGTRDHYLIARNFAFQCKTNIYKIGPIVEFNRLYELNGKKVVLAPHREGYQLKQGNGDDAIFFAEVIYFYYKTRDFKDGVILKFKSETDVDLSKSVLPENVLIDHNGLVITDHNGNFITG